MAAAPGKPGHTEPGLQADWRFFSYMVHGRPRPAPKTTAGCALDLGRIRAQTPASEGFAMPHEGYNLFCPVAKACEVLEPRWTLLLLCEMWAGSTRFNEIRRGVPGVSPTLMSKRLKEMEERSLVVRSVEGPDGAIHYRTTAMADELEPIVHALGQWAHRNIDADVTLERLDARLLMWNIRRKIDVAALPRRRIVIQFIYPELAKDERNYWLIAKPGAEVDLCTADPGHPVDLFVTADLKAITSAWMNLSSLDGEIARGRIELVGDPAMIRSVSAWMVRSSFVGGCGAGAPETVSRPVQVLH
jgi:DNA-binding HxlR family transcriptional regulator